jgi:hypothetical protein
MRKDMASMRSWNADPIQVPIGPVTRARAKKFQNALSGLVQGIWAQALHGGQLMVMNEISSP